MFLRHLLPFLFGKPVAVAEGLIFSPPSPDQTPAFAICALEATEMFMPFLPEVFTLRLPSANADKPCAAPGLFTILPRRLPLYRQQSHPAAQGYFKCIHKAPVTSRAFIHIFLYNVSFDFLCFEVYFLKIF